MSRKWKQKQKANPARWANLKLRVMAEYGSSGIWGIGQQGLWRHGMIEHSALGLPADLAQRFEQWIDFYDTRLADNNFDTAAFNRVGKTLALELKTHLGAAVYVEFVPEFDGGNGLGEAEEIQLASEP